MYFDSRQSFELNSDYFSDLMDRKKEKEINQLTVLLGYIVCSTNPLLTE